MIKKETVAAVSKTSIINQIETDKLSVFCSNIPVIRPIAKKMRGDVLTICL